MNNISAAFRGQGGLTSDYYEALVTASMTPYRLAVKRAEKRRDDLNVQKAVYDDLESKVDSLHSAVQSLRQITGEESVFDGKKVTSAATVSGSLVSVTATATSSAADASYNVNVTNLAEAHSVRGTQQADSTSALNYSGTFTLNGVSVTVATTDSLTDVMNSINTQMQAAVDASTISSDQDITATIIDKQLILTADSTGVTNAMTAADTSGTALQSLGVLTGGGAFANVLQAAEDAAFTVDGISITRSKNSGLSDVITGVTLELLREDQSTVTVEPDTAAVESEINGFISKLNDFNSWLRAKTDTVENNDGTYSRGALADNFSLRNLRRDLLQKVFAEWSAAPSGADYKRLSEVGFDVDENLNVTLDSGDLSTALSANYSDVVTLFDGIMDTVSSLTQPYSDGTNNLVDKMKTAAEQAVEDQNDKIERMNDSNERLEEVTRNQIANQFQAISSYNSSGQFLARSMFSQFA